jgi:hypothetical protein
MFSFEAEGFSSSLDVGGLGISKWYFLISCGFSISDLETPDPDPYPYPHSLETLDTNPDSMNPDPQYCNKEDKDDQHCFTLRLYQRASSHPIIVIFTLFLL